MDKAREFAHCEKQWESLGKGDKPNPKGQADIVRRLTRYEGGKSQVMGLSIEDGFITQDPILIAAKCAEYYSKVYNDEDLK